MPELPEVETIKNELLPLVAQHTITDITLLWDRIIHQPSPEIFRSKLIGQKIIGINRRGKYLIFDLTRGDKLIIHLRMTGSLLLRPAWSKPECHVHAIIFLNNQTAIHFRDMRKFGRMWLAKQTNDIISKLGPEPLEADFTSKVLFKLLKNRKAPIKALLLDQKIIAGIGNMYADEALFAAHIHPLRPGNSLHPIEVNHLHTEMQRILTQAIDDKGASTNTYLRPSGDTGIAHYQFRVAHRLGGDLCPACGTSIERIVVRNRGTYFCPKCQV